MNNTRKVKRNIVRTFAALCLGLLSIGFTACDDDLDVTQAYPFTVETMPVPKELAQGETAEIRCELVREGVNWCARESLTGRSIPSAISNTTGRAR